MEHAGANGQEPRSQKRKALRYEDVPNPVVERTFSMQETAAQLGVHYTKAARIFGENHPGVLVVSRGPKGRTERRVYASAIIAYLQKENPGKKIRPAPIIL